MGFMLPQAASRERANTEATEAEAVVVRDNIFKLLSFVAGLDGPA
jgi:hypothetical protein